jgi:hypothetical protein
MAEIAELHKAAAAGRSDARGVPDRSMPRPNQGDSVPAHSTPGVQRLHDRLAALDHQTLARVLGLYWYGSEALRVGVSEATLRSHLARAERQLDGAPWLLTTRPDLGKALRVAMALLGV